MPELFVNIHYSNRWATIHLRECSRVRGHIAGTNKPKTDTRPSWFGPFPTAQAAVECARNVDDRLAIDGCKKCKPPLDPESGN
jgi:hypothetical protein